MLSLIPLSSQPDSVIDPPTPFSELTLGQRVDSFIEIQPEHALLLDMAVADHMDVCLAGAVVYGIRLACHG